MQPGDEMEDRDSIVSGMGKSSGEVEMNFHEKVREWSVVNPTNEEGEASGEAQEPGSPAFNSRSVFGDNLDETHNKYYGEDADVALETSLSEMDAARINFVVNTSSFSWLLKAVKSRPQLDYSTNDVLKSIRKLAALALNRHRGNRALCAQRAVIRMAWDPCRFIAQQGYDGARSLLNCVTITGTTKKAQLLSCRDYLNQVWPITGEAVLEGVITLAKVSSGSVSKTLFDNLQLSLQLVDEGLQVECVGLFDSIVEVIEVLSWIGSALHESSIPYRITYSTAELKIRAKGVQRDSSAQFLLTFAEEEPPILDTLGTLNGGCWLNGFLKNPVIAKGFPTSLRSEEVLGLEVPLEVMALLLDTSQLTVFNRRVLLKGFNAAVIPTTYADSVIQWHLILNEDGSRLRYGDKRIAESPHIVPAEVTSRMQGARHFLGWTSNAAYNIGMAIYILRVQPSYPTLYIPASNVS